MWDGDAGLGQVAPMFADPGLLRLHLLNPLKLHFGKSVINGAKLLFLIKGRERGDGRGATQDPRGVSKSGIE